MAQPVPRALAADLRSAASPAAASPRRPHFELSQSPSFVLSGHGGPVVTLALTDTCL